MTIPANIVVAQNQLLYKKVPAGQTPIIFTVMCNCGSSQRALSPVQAKLLRPRRIPSAQAFWPCAHSLAARVHDQLLLLHRCSHSPRPSAFVSAGTVHRMKKIKLPSWIVITRLSRPWANNSLPSARRPIAPSTIAQERKEKTRY
jgi:hypothetical protein